MKFNIVLDSHIGEVYNISSMLYFWGDSKEIDHNDELSIFILRDKISAKDVLNELSWFKGKLTISSFNIMGNTKFYQLKNFLAFILKIFINDKPDINIIPYDQKSIFYFLFRALFKNINICVPHTTGPERYNNDVIKDMIQKKWKNIPILAKSSESELYYSRLGFAKQIYTGDYASQINYSNYVYQRAKSLGEKNKTELVLFSLGYIEKMFNFQDWYRSHVSIFTVVNGLPNFKLIIKLHPSQSKEEFFNTFKEFIQIDQIVDLHPESLARRCDVFLSIMTSAGHHAISNNKPHANFACNSLRKSVLEFGNDPYPYESFKCQEIINSSGLNNWLNIVELNNTCHKRKSSNCLSLAKIMDEL